MLTPMFVETKTTTIQNKLNNKAKHEQSKQKTENYNQKHKKIIK